MNTKKECRNCNDYGYTFLRDRTGGSEDGTWKEPCTKCNPVESKNETGVYNPDTGLYPDEDNVVLEDPYFDLHTDAFNFHSGEGPY